MSQETDKYKRISKARAALMVGAAILFDLMELLVDWIPIVGQVFSFIIDLIAVTVFAIWFLIAGAKLTNPRTAARFWITNLAELLPIPVIDFCLTTVGVILTIREVWREDVQEAEEKRAKEKQSAAMMAELQKRGGAQK